MMPASPHNREVGKLDCFFMNNIPVNGFGVGLIYGLRLNLTMSNAKMVRVFYYDYTDE